MKDRDIRALLQLPLDFEAAGGGDVFQVDPAEGSGDQSHRVDELVHILCLDAQRNSVHVAEGLEQDAFSFHDRHACNRSDVAQPEHGGAVRDYGAHIAAAGIVV